MAKAPRSPAKPKLLADRPGHGGETHQQAAEKADRSNVDARLTTNQGILDKAGVLKDDGVVPIDQFAAIAARDWDREPKVRMQA